MTSSAQTYIDALGLQAHPEGGFYRETYRSDHAIDVSWAGSTAPVSRSVCTGIYFLLEQGNFSAFHRIKSDEMWHFYAGQALEVMELTPDGALRCTRMGPAVGQGDVYQHVVAANTWFASRVAEGGEFSLVGCTVAPGFDFADFCLAERDALLVIYPQHQAAICALTR